MNDGLQQTHPPATANMVSQNGQKNVHVDHVDNMNNTINVILPPIPQRGANNTAAISPPIFTNEYYNLFVIGDEDFSAGHFIVPKNRALAEPEFIEKAIKAEFASLSEPAIAKIKTFPSIFASENHSYGKTDNEHLAIFGMVTDVHIQENGIKIHLHSLNYIPQQMLNEISQDLAICARSSFSELNHTHWTIKQIDLIEELTDAGLLPSWLRR
jgi:hypothetical protein